MSDGNWHHSICDPCWNRLNPDAAPTRNNAGDERQCCFCQDWHDSGIFIRMHPKNIKNHIDHYDDEEDDA